MKMKPSRLTTLMSIALALGGCSGPGYFEPQQPGGNTSVVYLYRPKASNPGMQPLRHSYPDIQIDGFSVGQLKFNTHFPITLQPGKHEIRVTGLTENSKWEPRDIKQNFTVGAGEVRYLKLNVQYNLSEMNLGQPAPSYLVNLVPMRSEDAIYEIRNTTRAE
ncbi:DUF2846 domain-containing protein [Pseudomonas sp. MAP12]|uniref:DUF2846 domain-containing protein n=1 Tax=Geopseudomonas aromaticivorans TaxID=2849492 RepID=A0ABS6MSG7_9GAMM|nr:DUF2846 domain-containing protein [Pseudomonas aromaticivorans]MBV2131750.1 DUF2846 domain-containing protein [Pseudomonas aromaticivorans]